MKRQCNYCDKIYEAKTMRSKFCRPTCRVHFNIVKNSPFVVGLIDELEQLKKKLSVANGGSPSPLRVYENEAVVKEPIIEPFDDGW